MCFTLSIASFIKLILHKLPTNRISITLIYHIGTLSKVLASIKSTSNCQTDFSSTPHLPIPPSTKVLLDHIEIDFRNEELLIFCKVIDNNWMWKDMVRWKGYTLIAITGLPGSPTVNQGWRFKGTGKMSILEKNVSSCYNYLQLINS